MAGIQRLRDTFSPKYQIEADLSPAPDVSDDDEDLPVLQSSSTSGPSHRTAGQRKENSSGSGSQKSGM